MNSWDKSLKVLIKPAQIIAQNYTLAYYEYVHCRCYFKMLIKRRTSLERLINIEPLASRSLMNLKHMQHYANIAFILVHWNNTWWPVRD